MKKLKKISKKHLLDKRTIRLIKLALEEDLDGIKASGDRTSHSIIPARAQGTAVFCFRKDGVLCGLPILKKVFRILNPKIKVKSFYKEGSLIKANDGKNAVIRISGPARAILAGERTALNFIQILSGLATGVRALYPLLPKDSKTILLDTRKTIPGWRGLSKYAVRIGAQISKKRIQNHRLGLYDALMVKDNHLHFVSIPEAVKKLRKSYGKKFHITLEADTPKQVYEALKTDAERILLDNMNKAEIKAIIRSIPTEKKKEIEVSGGIQPEVIHRIAFEGVDFISMGSMTMRIHPIDIGLDWIDWGKN